MAKILLIAGHGAGDPGAIGNGTSEAVETRRVVNALVSPLKKNGMNVTVYDQNKNAFTEAQAGRLNFGGIFDYVFEVHFNSFNSQAKGTEAFITSSESSDSIEQDIVTRLSKYFVSRGVKRTNFSVIYNAKLQGMSSCLYEMCFIDNAADMQAYNNNFNSIITDIANAIASGFGNANGNTNDNTETPTQKSGDDDMYILEKVLKNGNVEVWFVDGENRSYLPEDQDIKDVEYLLSETGRSKKHVRFSHDNRTLKAIEKKKKEVKY